MLPLLAGGIVLPEINRVKIELHGTITELDSASKTDQKHVLLFLQSVPLYPIGQMHVDKRLDLASHRPPL